MFFGRFLLEVEHSERGMMKQEKIVFKEVEVNNLLVTEHV